MWHRHSSLQLPLQHIQGRHLSGVKARSTASDAVQTVQQCLSAFSTKSFDHLLDMLPDEVVDYLVEQRKIQGRENPIQFQDLLDTEARLALQKSFVLDSYALRNLVYTKPASHNVLSSILVSPTKFMQRCAVSSDAGEDTIITFSLELQDSLQAQYKGIQMSRRWMLRGITGEYPDEDLPLSPSPDIPPEAVVRAQLQALSCKDFATVFSFASPENKDATGPLERFRGMVESQFSTLVQHRESRSLNRVQVNESTYMELVHVTGRSIEDGRPGSEAIYVWCLSRQPAASALCGCWMTDSVQVFRILKT